MNIVLMCSALLSADPVSIASPTPAAPVVEPAAATTETPAIAPWDHDARLAALERDVAQLKKENAELKAKIALCPCSVNTTAAAPATAPPTAVNAPQTICSNGVCYQVQQTASGSIYYQTSGACASGSCGTASGDGSCASCGSSGSSGRRSKRHR